MSKPKKFGSAIPMVLIFSLLLFAMGLAYSKSTQQSKIQTIQIDERIKLNFLAESMAELAMLKFQLYPADFYVCQDLADNKGNPAYLNDFTVNAAEFRVDDNSSDSSFNNQPVHIELKDMRILTDNKWKKEVLSIEIVASYLDIFQRPVDKVLKRVVEVERLTSIPKKI